ncbi:MAG: flagellar hook-length control protein FliK [Acidobacteriota bacterium]
MKINPSTNPPAASRPTNKPSNQPPMRGFDAMLDQLDELAEGEVATPSDLAALLDQGSLREAQAESVGSSDGERVAEDDQKTPTAAEDAARAALMPTQRDIRPEAAAEVTPRRILHVLDMEKILATVRTQTFSGNEAQATIQLSHSILHGLSITLQTDARGRVSAEITATTEAAKRIVDAHARELNDMLQARGLDVDSFSTKLADADASASSGSDSSASSPFGRRQMMTDVAAEAVDATDIVAPAALPGSEDIYTA